MLKILLFSIVLWVVTAIFGCKDKEADLPPHIIHIDTMVKVFTDLHIMEALSIQGSIKHNDSLNSVAAFREGILEKYQLDSKRFGESYQFYTENPEQLNKIYTEVLIELSKKKAEAEN